MTPIPTDFNRGVIAPIECFKEGWELVKDRYWLFFGITAVGMLLGGLFAIVLMGPMMCGIFICYFEYQRRRPVEFGMLFKGFDDFLPAFLVQLIKSIPTFILSAVFSVSYIAILFSNIPRHGEPPPEFMVTVFGFEIVFFGLLMLIHFFVEIFALFALPLVTDRKLPPIDALKTSFAASRANIGGVIGLLLLDGLLKFASAMVCGVGMYFYLPISFAAYTIAYRKVFADLGPMTYSPPPPPPQSWAA